MDSLPEEVQGLAVSWQGLRVHPLGMGLEGPITREGGYKAGWGHSPSGSTLL